jgi:predicted transcriptional regulator
MADGELTLKLDDETARRLQEAADAAGRPLNDYVADLITDHLATDDDWAEDVRIAEACERTGEYVSVEEALHKFRDDLEVRLASKK